MRQQQKTSISSSVVENEVNNTSSSLQDLQHVDDDDFICAEMLVTKCKMLFGYL